MSADETEVSDRVSDDGTEVTDATDVPDRVPDGATDDVPMKSEHFESWRAYVHMQEVLSSRLEQHLLRTARLSNADYTVLIVLSEAPDGRLRGHELTATLGWERSRLYHQLARMATRGLLRRENDPAQPRPVYAVITPAGRQAIVDAAPSHLREVQRLLLGELTDRQIAQLGAISRTVLAKLYEPDDAQPARASIGG